MPLHDAPFYPEIQALDENFSQYFYAVQRDWLERGQINFDAVKALWDIINNVHDNLEDLGISLDQLQQAMNVVEGMNSHVSGILEEGETTEQGIIFSGTREEYVGAGNALLDKLYQLQSPVSECKKTLIEMAQNY